MISESLLQIELNLNNKTKIICQLPNNLMCGLSRLCTENEKKSNEFFKNLLYNFVRIGVYQLKKFTNNCVNIFDIIKN